MPFSEQVNSWLRADTRCKVELFALPSGRICAVRTGAHGFRYSDAAEGNGVLSALHELDQQILAEYQAPTARTNPIPERAPETVRSGPPPSIPPFPRDSIIEARREIDRASENALRVSRKLRGERND